MAYNPETEKIDSKVKITNAEVISNGLLKITFSDGEECYIHPDALYQLMDDEADRKGVVWPDDDDGDDDEDDD